MRNYGCRSEAKPDRHIRNKMFPSTSNEILWFEFDIKTFIIKENRFLRDFEKFKKCRPFGCGRGTRVKGKSRSKRRVTLTTFWCNDTYNFQPQIVCFPPTLFVRFIYLHWNLCVYSSCCFPLTRHIYSVF